MRKSVLDDAVELRNNGRHDLKGFEHLDDTPIEVPLEFKQVDPVAQAVINILASRRVKEDLSRVGVETEEEANDFDVPGDMPVPTPFEIAGDERFDSLVARAKEREKAASKLPKGGNSHDGVSEHTAGNSGDRNGGSVGVGGSSRVDSEVSAGSISLSGAPPANPPAESPAALRPTVHIT